MINNRRRVVSKLVKYIRRCYPKVLPIVRTMDSEGLGLPDIVIPETRCCPKVLPTIRNVYRGLALWAMSEITDSRMDQMDKFVDSGHAVSISDDYDVLRSTIGKYMSLDRPSRGEYATDTIQLAIIKDRNIRGSVPARHERLEREALTSSDIDTLDSVVSFIMEKYKYAAIMPTFGSESGPDITIFSHKSVHNGLMIWLSKSRMCYRLHNLSDNQFNHLYKMAKKSYLTIASSDYQDITDIIDFYMDDDYEHYGGIGSTPEFLSEDDDC